MSMMLQRRAVLSAGLAALSLATVGGGPAFAQAARLRLLWWGSQERADRTNKVIAAYKQVKPNLDIAGEFAGWSDYWPRLATQVAGRNAPDLIQMDYRYIFEYARRGALAPLDDYLGKGLKIDDFGTPNIDSGRVDGKLYGINLGVNSSAVFYDAAAWEKAGVKAPSAGQTWEEFAKNAVEFGKKKSKPGYFATADASGVEPSFENWLRQSKKSLFSEEGGLGYNAKDAGEWFKMWADMRGAGACVPADIQALDQLNIESNALTTGKAATAFAHSNQFVGYQAVNKAKLSITSYPKVSKDSPSGHYLKPSMLMSVAKGSAGIDAAVDFINFLVAVPEGVDILGVERGVPASEAMRNQLSPKLNDVSKAMVEYIAEVTPGVGPLPPAPPPGAGEFAFVLKQTAEEVAFGRVTPEQGGERLVKEAETVIKRK
ncbi:ABC transporter substrate-binding protein [Agrobacterium sp. rho-13.3]|jgi:multiple sugar transport system substrate-binding protein|uniref:ABC transporter substrate-binding protein n=1 Tax=Agrobacterium sp. rho-13.3 TaxID=3072980 RepID=UPI002A12BC98|nr:ABC transporter substrate-binding protein [Agrobacterium sp. rho-13.3]MDX8306454.1 ABC transporter substrate-binding protein [Agrobacterium sp. rho-13.3]MDX8307215.1 ABC transporter substrate-binding protein [Agrobacterium sp. rho-13.3]